MEDPSKGCIPSGITYALYSDSLCTSLQNVPGRIEIIGNVLTFMGGATVIGSPEIIYMCAKELDGHLISRKIEMNVCGNEQVELIPGKIATLSVSYDKNSGSLVDGLVDSYQSINFET